MTIFFWDITEECPRWRHRPQVIGHRHQYVFFCNDLCHRGHSSDTGHRSQVTALLGNPQVDLADLRIESAICTICGFEDCGFPYTSQKRMRICGLNPQSALFAGLQIADSPTQVYTTCMYMMMYVRKKCVFLLSKKLLTPLPWGQFWESDSIRRL